MTTDPSRHIFLRQLPAQIARDFDAAFEQVASGLRPDRVERIRIALEEIKRDVVAFDGSDVLQERVWNEIHSMRFEFPFFSRLVQPVFDTIHALVQVRADSRPLKEIVDASPRILKMLANPDALQREEVFTLFMELIEANNLFALDFLVDAFFSLRKQHELDRLYAAFARRSLQGNAKATHFLVAVACVMESIGRGREAWVDDVRLLHRSQFSSLMRWRRHVQGWSFYGKDMTLEDTTPHFQCKVLLAQAFRREILVNALTGGEPALPYPETVTSKCFPQTAAWIIGLADGLTLDDIGNHTSLSTPYAEMNALARRYGIEVVVGTQYPIPDKEITRVPQSAANIWVQDNQAWCSIRGALTARVSAIPLTPFQTYRRELKAFCRLHYPDMRSELLGSVGLHGEQFKALIFAYVAKTPFRINPCYSEEGNVLIGSDEGGPYAIIGESTKIVAAAHMRDEMYALGYVRREGVWRQGDISAGLEAPSDEEMQRLFAYNYGIAPDRIYFCPQPSSFHLDMAMKLIGPKTVLVSDSVQAAEWMLKSGPPVEGEKRDAYLAQAQRKQRGEDQAAQHLEALGFRVIRFGGKTYDPRAASPEEAQINLFNFVSGTAPDGRAFAIALGCNAFFQKKLCEVMPRGVEVHFLPKCFSRRLLTLCGGIECMVKSLEHPLT